MPVFPGWLVWAILHYIIEDLELVPPLSVSRDAM